MTYKIVCDSGCDFNEEDRQDPVFIRVPLTLRVGEEEIIDDDSFDQPSFLEKVDACEECPHSACPSEGAFLDAYIQAGDVDVIFVVALTKKLSGSYNAAHVAKEIYTEEGHGKAKIVVIDSRSAAVGETVIALKLRELMNSGMPLREVVHTTAEFVREMSTFFTLETIDTFRKNGRMNGVTFLMANALNIKLVLYANRGEIAKYTQAVGMKKSIDKMIAQFVSEVKDPETKVLGITHINCPERAEEVRDKILALTPFRSVYIVNGGGISSLYANQGGIIITA